MAIEIPVNFLKFFLRSFEQDRTQQEYCMTNLKILVATAILVTASATVLAAGTGRAAGTPIVNPTKSVNKTTCLSCHTTVKTLHQRGAHAKLNCGSCHTVDPQHLKSPSAQNRPTVNTSHAACAQCHKQEFKDMINPKYQYDWAKNGGNSNYGQIRDRDGQNLTVQKKLPRFHVGIMAEVAVNRSSGRFEYKDPSMEGRPVVRLWDAIVDTRPEDGNRLDTDKTNTPMCWRPHKDAGNAVAYCLKCKGTDNILEWAYRSEKHPQATVDKTSLALPTMRSMNSSFNCIYCHDPHSAEPRVINDYLVDTMSNPALKNYYQDMAGKPGFTKAEIVTMGMRGYPRKIAILERYDSNYMCGQCHMVFNAGYKWRKRSTDEIVSNVTHNDPILYPSPFVKGGPIAFWQWYKDHDLYSAKDAATGAKMINNGVHLHVEMLSQSKHGQAGVGCTDCHYGKNKGKFEHNPSLPKAKVANTCMRSGCHTGSKAKIKFASEAQALYTIEAIQQKGRFLKDKVDRAGRNAYDFLKQVKDFNLKIDPLALEELQDAYSRLKYTDKVWFTDYSIGFHWPEQYSKDMREIRYDVEKKLAAAKKSVESLKSSAK